VNGFDFIIIQRNLFYPEIWDACTYWRAMGKIVCADLDDDYPRLTQQNPAHGFWIRDIHGIMAKIGMTPVRALENALGQVDALLSPSKEILSDWGDIVPGYWVPNYAEGAWYEDIEQKPLPGDNEPIIIGWGGSVSHFDSWWFSGIRKTMIPLLEKYPRLHWKLCGNDWRLMGWAKDTLPTERWHHQPGVSPQEWPQQVASFDIGVAPLCGLGAPQAETYDNRRSWLKAVEYLLCGVPWLSSPGPVYRDLDGQGGHLVRENSPEAWMEAISETIDNLAQYKERSRALMSWAKDTLTIDARVEDAYIQLLNRIRAEAQSRTGLRLPNITYVGDMIEQAAQAQG